MNYYGSGGKKSRSRRSSKKHKSSGSRKSHSNYSMEELINKLSPYQTDTDLFSKYNPMNFNMGYYKIDEMFGNELKNVPLNEIKLDDPRLKEVLSTSQNINSSVQNTVDPQIDPDKSWLLHKYDSALKKDSADVLPKQSGGFLYGMNSNPYLSPIDRRNARKMEDNTLYKRQVFEGQIEGNDKDAFNMNVLGEMGTNMTLLRDKEYGIPSQSKNAYAVLYKPYQKQKDQTKSP